VPLHRSARLPWRHYADVAWHLRDHCFVTELFTLRRTDDSARNLRSGLRRQRQNEIHYPSGEHHVVTIRQLDAILNGRSFPADFWAVVSAADAAFASGNMDVLIEWPSGRRATA
jgi:hypothetical protein